MWVWRSKKWCQKPLKSSDQNVGLATALGQFFDLQIFGRNHTAEKIDFTFETGDIAIIGPDLSRQVGAGRSDDGYCIFHKWRSVIRRDLPRQAVACRAGKFGNLRNVTCDRLRCDHVFVAERRFLSQAVEVTFCAIALDGSDRSGMASVLVANSRLVDGEGVLVGACRDKSRRVVGHH